MGYREDMENCRRYISSHPDENLTAEKLAGKYGYSFFHFCHVFKSCNGISVGEYLRDARLGMAAVEILSGVGMTIAALDAGFDTLSGFDRAFRKKFGMTPSEYRKMKGSAVDMVPEIRKMADFTAVGYTFAPNGDTDILENGAYWLGKKFDTVSREDYEKLSVDGHGEIGTWLHPLDGAGDMFYFFGPMVLDKSFVPEGMTAIDVPAAEYAVFEVPESDGLDELHENIQKTWKFVFGEWFDGSGYRFDHKAMDFEYYIGDRTFIYVPVKEA